MSDAGGGRDADAWLMVPEHGRRQNVSAAAPIFSKRVNNSQMAENDNGVTFALEDEDHTLANALRFFLNKK